MDASDKFIEDLRGRISYFRQEFTLSYAEALGVLDMLHHELLMESYIDDASEEEEEGDL